MNLINDNLNILNIINDNSLEETTRKKTLTDTLIKNERIIVNKENIISSSLNNSINKTYFKKLKNFNNIKYGIDENGNPINISEYFNNKINIDGNKKPRLIAYISKDENKNVLLDLNGNKILKKNEEGDYEFPFLLNILIKDFDVQHPELRVNGERRYTNPVSKENTINNSEKKCENNLIKGIKGKFLKYKYYSKNNSIDKRNNNIKQENIIQNRNFKKTSNILKNIRLNKTSNNSVDYNNYSGNEKEIISRTNSILNIIKSKNKNYNFKNYNTYSLNNKKKEHNIILYNINNKKKIPINPYQKNKFIKPKINIVENSNKSNDNYNQINYSLNLNSNKNINNDIIIKKKYKYSFTINKSNGNLPFYDINHNDNISTTNTYNDINNDINTNNSIYNNSKINSKIEKGIKEKLIKNNKYLNNQTIIMNKYFPNYTENNIDNNNLNKNKKNTFKMINKKLSLNKIIHSNIRTIDSSGNKNIKTIEKNKINNNNKNIKNNNKNKFQISKLFPNILNKKIKNNRYSILSKEANNMIKIFLQKKS